jgi:diadenosine tetraphosphate (Ap4A) HIT family hydrolase
MAPDAEQGVEAEPALELQVGAASRQRCWPRAGAKVSAVALEVAYDSEAAFSRAFKIVGGCAARGLALTTRKPLHRRAMTTLIHARVAQARCGQNPTVIGRMASGWAVLGDCQFPRGYSLLLPDPVVGSINELGPPARDKFLSDMVAIGDALLAVTSAYRINYELQGNSDPALHAHIFARYRDEDPARIGGPVWMYDAAQRHAQRFDPTSHAGLLQSLSEWLRSRALIA